MYPERFLESNGKSLNYDNNYPTLCSCSRVRNSFNNSRLAREDSLQATGIYPWRHRRGGVGHVAPEIFQSSRHSSTVECYSFCHRCLRWFGSRGEPLAQQQGTQIPGIGSCCGCGCCIPDPRIRRTQFVRFNLLQGRLGKHRLHPMLVHFPTALYPFSLVMDTIGFITGNSDYLVAGRLSLFAAVGMSVPAMLYGLLDFLKINTNSSAWKKAGLHAILNLIWFMIYCTILFYRIKHDVVGNLYLAITAVTTIGLFYSNYLGADLIIFHRIGIRPEDEQSSKDRHMQQ
jgi:uncharacterized membrane protein